jgi:hypothetical protein
MIPVPAFLFSIFISFSGGSNSRTGVIALHTMSQFWIDQVLVAIYGARVTERSDSTAHAI